MSGWVSVKERLPELGERAWVYNDSPASRSQGTAVTIAAYRARLGKVGFISLTSSGYALESVTHWMPARPPVPPAGTGLCAYEAPPAEAPNGGGLLGQVREALAGRKRELWAVNLQIGELELLLSEMERVAASAPTEAAPERDAAPAAEAQIKRKVFYLSDEGREAKRQKMKEYWRKRKESQGGSHAHH